MKLNDKEIKEMYDVINEYNNIFNNISKVEEEIKLLFSKQSELKKSLENNREKEKMFTEFITRKYGKGKFNLETLEYELIL